MKQQTGNVVRNICATIICVIAIVAHYRSSSYLKAVVPSAERLYPLLVGYDFEGIEIYESENRLSLYRYATENEHSSIRIRKEVASIPVDAEVMKDIQLFKDVMKYSGGVFFATDLNWNGEWSGLCFYPSDPLLIPDRYILRSTGNQIYLLSNIPDSVIH